MTDMEMGKEPLVDNAVGDDTPTTQPALTLDGEYEKMVADMRKVFQTTKTHDIEWRRKQLQQVVTMIEESAHDMYNAVQEEFSGGMLRLFSDISCGQQAMYNLDHLDEWANPEWVSGIFNRAYVRRDPKGVCLIIAPWNFPFTLCLVPLIAALTAGCCAVLKPSEMTPKCSAVLKTMVEKYLDPECVKVVLGAVPETTALLNQRWDHLYYTGSTRIGRVIMQAAVKNLTPVSLELGGKCPVIIDETADVELAAERVSDAKWYNAGQICIAPDHVLVHESKAKQFKELMLKLVKERFGPTVEETDAFCKVITESHVDRVRKAITDTKGKVLIGGADGIVKENRYVPPTIIEDPALEDNCMQEEIFGPVCPIVTFKKIDEAIKIVNSKGTPLAMYYFTSNMDSAEMMQRKVQSGMVCINTCTEQALVEGLPFAGKGESGIGGGGYYRFGFDDFTWPRASFYRSTLPGFKAPALPPPVFGQPPAVGPDQMGLMLKLSIRVLPFGLKRVLRSKWFWMLIYALIVFILFVTKFARWVMTGMLHLMDGTDGLF